MLVWSASKGEVEQKSKKKKKEGGKRISAFRLMQVDWGLGNEARSNRRDRKSPQGSECLQSGTCFYF